MLFTETFIQFWEQMVIIKGTVWIVHGVLEHCSAKLLQEVCVLIAEWARALLCSNKMNLFCGLGCLRQTAVHKS